MEPHNHKIYYKIKSGIVPTHNELLNNFRVDELIEMIRVKVKIMNKIKKHNTRLILRCNELEEILKIKQNGTN